VETEVEKTRMVKAEEERKKQRKKE